MTAESLRADVVIVGAGVAGLCVALSIDSRLKVIVLAKRSLGSATSGWAQGGIAAVSSKEDSFAEHIEDTIEAGDGLCRLETVTQIIEQAPEAISWLHQQGVNFNTDSEGGWALNLEGGHRHRRIVHVEDHSGESILSALVDKVSRRQNIKICENHIAIDLSCNPHHCEGLYALNTKTSQVSAITASAVVLASGGAGRVYLYSTTPEEATGDGIAMAFRAGCKISNMEFIQFHPTCLYHPTPPTLLITEAIRGEGATLVNEEGLAFIEHPQGDLASRDIVARAIDAEMKKTGADCVYLDCQDKNSDFWKQRFPTIARECQRRNIVLSENRIPVVPAAHYCCGGVMTDLNGQTSIPNLYAVGEVSHIGFHGANRLASNSLLECVVIGRQCGINISTTLTTTNDIPIWDEKRISLPQEQVMVSHNWDELRRIMWNYVGIVRSDERLQRARRRVTWIAEEIDEYYRQYKVSRDFIELRNITQCAEIIIDMALARRESRGLHYNLNCLQKKEKITESVVTQEDYKDRNHAINQRCPFSSRLIVAGSTAFYRNYAVGFCNPDCRDDFMASIYANFQGVSKEMLAAKNLFDSLIDLRFGDRY